MLTKRPPLGYLFGKVRADIGVVLVLTCTFASVSAAYDAHLPSIPLSIPAFMVTVVTVLLSFKLSQSYDRWWEARKIWGAIVNDSRTLARQVLSFPSAESDAVRTIVLRQIAWCYCLSEALRGRPWSRTPSDALSERDADAAHGHANPSLALLQQHAANLTLLAQLGLVTDYQRIAIDETLSRLTDHMGKAERIRNTVFPTTYSLFLHVSIYLVTLVFTFAVEPHANLWVVPLALSIATVFFFLEKTAIHMQDPFSDRPTDTAVTSIARTIDINLRQLLGHPNIPRPLEPNDFYLM